MQGHIAVGNSLMIDQGVRDSGNQMGLNHASDQQERGLPQLTQILESPNPPKQPQQDNFLNGF